MRHVRVNIAFVLGAIETEAVRLVYNLSHYSTLDHLANT